MKMKTILAAVIAVSMLFTATACEKNGNGSLQSSNSSISDTQTDGETVNNYKEFFNYTFNGNYSVAEPEYRVTRADTEYEQKLTQWDITYYLKNGQERVATYRSSEYNDIDAQYYKSKETHDLSELDSFITLLLGDVVKTEFIEKIASKYLELQYDSTRGVYICPDIGDLSLYAYTPVFIGAYEGEEFDKSCEITRERLSVGSGYVVSGADMKSICSDSDFIFTCQFVINHDLDNEKYTEIIENMMNDFKEYVGSPQNFNFFLAETETPEWIMRTMHFKGEEVPADKIDSGEFVYADEIKKSILENH